MFRPNYGICTCHGEKRLLVVKSGLCKQGNDDRKQLLKRNSRQLNKNGNVVAKTDRGKIPLKLSSGMDIEKNYSCQPGRSPRKVDQKAKPPFRKTRKSVQRTQKRTGEAALFKEIFEERSQRNWPECPICDTCGTGLGFEAKVFFFSHVLAKSTYPSLRLSRANIWIVCLKCHQEWDQGDRNQEKFKLKRLCAENLKREYYATRNKNRR